MNDVDSLFGMAVKAEQAPPLDTSAVMRRIAAVSGAASVFAPSMRFFVGIGAVAAALAVVVTGLSAAAWAALHDPIQVMRTLPDILSFLKI